MYFSHHNRMATLRTYRMFEALPHGKETLLFILLINIPIIFNYINLKCFINSLVTAIATATFSISVRIALIYLTFQPLDTQSVISHF